METETAAESMCAITPFTLVYSTGVNNIFFSFS